MLASFTSDTSAHVTDITTKTLTVAALGYNNSPFQLEKVTVNGNDKIRVHTGKLYARVDTCSMSAVAVLTGASYHATQKTDGQAGRPDRKTGDDGSHSHTRRGSTADVDSGR